jgi:predicted MFS family arabinose efflux permease
MFAAALAGLIGHYIAREGIFYLVAAMAIASIIAVWQIRERDIDPDLASGKSKEVVEATVLPQKQNSSIASLFRDRSSGSGGFLAICS